MRKCTACHLEKPTSEFYRWRRKGGSQYQCKDCQNSRINAWAAANPQHRKEQRREYNLKRKYGITVSDYEQMLAYQEGVCWICKKPPRKRRLAVDHNHKTGRVRGLLCLRCNSKLLPLVRENADILQRAADYIKLFN